MRRLLLIGVSLLALVATACGGGSEAEPLTPEQAGTYFDNIDRLLDEAVTAHEGDPDQAAELVGEAYLENFEHLEHDLEEKDQNLNERLEGLLGPPFRQAIKKGLTQEAMESRVTEIKGLLEDAKGALGVA